MGSIKTLILVAILVSLQGCGLFATKPNAEVLIPVVGRCPEAPDVPRPHLAIQDLTDNAGPADVAMAYKLTVKKLQQWGLEQEALLDGYRKKGTE